MLDEIIEYGTTASPSNFNMNIESLEDIVKLQAESVDMGGPEILHF